MRLFRFPKKKARKRNASRWVRNRRLTLEALEGRDLLAADLFGVGLLYDTGASANDEVTMESTIDGTVGWSSPDTYEVLVEFDHNGDYQPDGAVTAYSSGDYVYYDPRWSDTSLDYHEGNLDLSYRTVERRTSGDVVNGWNVFSFTLDRVAPYVNSMSPDTDELLATSPYAAYATFNEAIDGGSLSSSNSQVWRNSDYSTPSQTVSLSGEDTAMIVFAESLAGSYTTNLQYVTDVAGNAMEGSAYAHDWRVMASPTSGGIPDVNVQEDAPDSYVALTSYFADEYDDVYSLSYSIVSNDNSTLFDSTNISSGYLTLDYAADQNGSANLTVEAMDSDGLSMQVTFAVNVASVNDAPQITGFTGVEGITVWTFSGYVQDEDLSNLQITFGGLLAGRTAQVDRFTGYFMITVEPEDLPYDGMVTAQTTDSEGEESEIAEFWVNLI